MKKTVKLIVKETSGGTDQPELFKMMMSQHLDAVGWHLLERVNQLQLVDS